MSTQLRRCRWKCTGAAPSPAAAGGAVVVDEVDVVLGNVTFTNNSASCEDMADISNCGGGGLLVRQATPAARRLPVCRECSKRCSPAALTSLPATPPPLQARSVLRLVVSNCTYRNNYVMNGGFGGAVYARYGGYGRVDTSLFLGNQAGSGGRQAGPLVARGALRGAWRGAGPGPGPRARARRGEPERAPAAAPGTGVGLSPSAPPLGPLAALTPTHPCGCAGGAVWFNSLTCAAAIFCVFRENGADNAGGLLFSNSSDCSGWKPHADLPGPAKMSATAIEYLNPQSQQSYSSLTLNCSFITNSVQLDGGAMYISTANAPSLIDT
jgi:hypothetical protein